MAFGLWRGKQPESAPKRTAGTVVRLKSLATIIAKAGLAVLVFGIAVSATSYIRTPAITVISRADSSVQINEVTRLYPVTMARVVTPRSIEEISTAVRSAAGPVSIGGGRFSMGGQTATPDGVQIDMREFHGVISLDSAARTVTVRAGTRWRELQEVLDKAGLAVKIMQTYNTFTVGGALSVNAHGRYIGQGPLVRSVREITLVLADGTVTNASSAHNEELFYAAIGGYGAVGIIATATLDLAENTRVRREDEKLPVSDYLAFFRRTVRNDSTVIFHNADVYPTAYETVNAVRYRTTNDPVTVTDRLQPKDQSSWSHRTAYTVISAWPGGKWTREHIIDPLLFRGNPVTWRNYEASYDVSELEPDSRNRSTYVLQEYFVPVDSLMVFLPRMRAVLRKHDVNAVNVSIRHALPDPGTALAWAPNEVFAFVLYYKQATDPESRRAVGRWTRELIDAAIASGGRYYLPYQPVATRAQFMTAYPGATKLFDVKRKVDSTGKFTNALWDLYMPDAGGGASPVTAAHLPANLPAEARMVLDTLKAYTRNEASEYLTHAEWDLVYGSEAYASWLEQGRKPSAFPYIGSVGTFWRSYRGTYDAASQRSAIAAGTHVMLGVIGVSTAVEYGIKGVYEGTIGRLSELVMPQGGTAEDHYAGRVARDYAKLIATRGWYEFPFGSALGDLWTKVPLIGPGFVRKWERRFALSLEYSIKAAYAGVIGLGTAAGYDPDATTRYAVTAGWNASSPSGFRHVASLDRGYSLMAVDRYDSYRDALLALSDQAGSVRIAEIDGSELVTLCGTAPAGWTAPARASAVVAYAQPDDRLRVRMLLSVPARDLLDVLHQLRSERTFKVEHIYDY